MQKTYNAVYMCSFCGSKLSQNHCFFKSNEFLLYKNDTNHTVNPKFAEIRTQIQMYLISLDVGKVPVLVLYSQLSLMILNQL